MAALGRARKSGAGNAALAEASFHVGEARLAAGDSERALALYQGAAAEESPRAAAALYKLGVVRLTRGGIAPASAAMAAVMFRQKTSRSARFIHPPRGKYRAAEFSADRRWGHGGRARSLPAGPRGRGYMAKRRRLILFVGLGVALVLLAALLVVGDDRDDRRQRIEGAGGVGQGTQAQLDGLVEQGHAR